MGVIGANISKIKLFGNLSKIGVNGNIGKIKSIGSVGKISNIGWVFEKITTDFKVGTEYGGGIIAYLGNEGDFVNGMIVAPVDASTTNHKWGCWGTLIGTLPDMGTGSINTDAIVGGCSEEGIAAKICNDLSLNGYTDWFLPSRDELTEIRLNKSEIDANIIESSFYNTSSEASGHLGNAYEHAWGIRFDDGFTGVGSKNNNRRVRAVRGF